MKIIIFIFFLSFFSRAIASDDYIWQIVMNDERIIKAKIINFESQGSIKFTDDYDLERILKVDDIKVIKRIQNLANSTDCILLKDNTKIIGDISDYVPGKYISLISEEKLLLKLEINQIEKIIIVDRPLFQGEVLKYYELGGTIGYPSGLNLNMNYFNSNFGIGLSGAYIFIADGIQLSTTYCFSNNLIYRHGLSFLAGLSNIRKDKYGSGGVLKNFHWQYIGLSYNINYKGFYSEFGLSLGSGNYSNPNFIFQLGYIHRFLQ